MALTYRSTFLYGFTINQLNSSIDFVAQSGGQTLLATLNFGYYSLTGLATEIERAMHAADQNNDYTVTVNRNVSGGLENRVTITTDGSYLDLLFSSGPRAASSISTVIGYQSADYTGSTSYTGNQSAGTILVTTMAGYTYLGPEFHQKVFGSVNVSASGVKEAIVYGVQRFTKVQFKHEPKAKVLNEWFPFMQWAMLQRPFEFTPEVTSPSTVYDVTLEKSSADGKGLAFQFTEMLPSFPNYYDVGSLEMRVTESS